MDRCIYCRQDLPDGSGFANHWRHWCEQNPEVTNE